MISFLLDVEDLADTRFAISPLREVMGSLRALRAPALFPLHVPWRRSVLARLDPADARLLTALVGENLALPDFLTPRPTTFAPTIEDQLTVVRTTPEHVVRRDLYAAHAPRPLPDALRQIAVPGAAPVAELLEETCELLLRYWELALLPHWPRMRLVLEADITHRARQLATGGARLLFSDLHRNVRWRDGVLRVDRMIGRHQVDGSGRGYAWCRRCSRTNPRLRSAPTSPRCWPTRAGAPPPCGSPHPTPTPRRSPRCSAHPARRSCACSPSPFPPSRSPVCSA